MELRQGEPGRPPGETCLGVSALRRPGEGEIGGALRMVPVLGADSVSGQHRGIFWVEVGVAVTVSGVMLKIFYMFAARGRDADEF